MDEIINHLIFGELNFLTPYTFFSFISNETFFTKIISAGKNYSHKRSKLTFTKSKNVSAKPLNSWFCCLFHWTVSTTVCKEHRRWAPVHVVNIYKLPCWKQVANNYMYFKRKSSSITPPLLMYCVCTSTNIHITYSYVTTLLSAHCTGWRYL